MNEIEIDWIEWMHLLYLIVWKLPKTPKEIEIKIALNKINRKKIKSGDDVKLWADSRQCYTTASI